MKAKQILQGLLSEAGIKINGPDPWDIQVKDNRFYRRVLSDHALGLGESYMDGWWECEALDEFINRVLKASINERIKGNWKMTLYILQTKLFNRQKQSRASQVSELHYDLGNDFYQANPLSLQSLLSSSLAALLRYSFYQRRLLHCLLRALPKQRRRRFQIAQLNRAECD